MGVECGEIILGLRDFQLKKYPKISCSAGILGLSQSIAVFYRCKSNKNKNTN
jgi:hypothetical protein